MCSPGAAERFGCDHHEIIVGAELRIDNLGVPTVSTFFEGSCGVTCTRSIAMGIDESGRIAGRDVDHAAMVDGLATIDLSQLSGNNPSSARDINENGFVGFSDLLIVLTNWTG